MSPIASRDAKSSGLMPTTFASSISSDFWPSISNSRLRCARSLMSALACISTRPASVFAQITDEGLAVDCVRHRARLFAPRQCLSYGWRSSNLVAQFTPQDLADGGLRQFGAEFHDLGPLVAGEIGLAVRAHLRFCH